MAGQRSGGMRDLAARVVAMIRIEAIWLATEPLDMRAGAQSALARVVTVFGAARPHHAYCFANRRANRMKVLVHDGFGIWLAARRLHRGKFIWAEAMHGPHMPQPTAADSITLSPTFRRRTERPLSTISPTDSWPTQKPVSALKPWPC